ncbi:hypothetical protein PQR71_07685 [Paraburkholderia fungorum]|uniref:hypothetical protein n=1 Tax=Paraburkholderia fungorum TaxID=134537 RepID=UPI0038B7458A
MQDSDDKRKQQTAALLQVLALAQRDVEVGNYRDIDEFFAELDSDDENLINTANQ